MKADAVSGALYSIAELAREFGVSTRTIRFYEARGLIAPDRVGVTRVFRRADRIRLSLIMRGKRLGFTLKEIAEYLALYEIDPDQEAQTAHLDRQVGDRIALLERQLEDLHTTLSELRGIKKMTEALLARRRALAGG